MTEIPGIGPEASGLAERALAIARSKLGAPYVWATAGPETFDCSGFTWWVASQVLGPLDFELRSSHHQFNVWGERVPDGSSLLPGDLVFFNTTGAWVMGNLASHVGLYVGGGAMIHAANEDLGVRWDGVWSEWYGPRYLGARRIFLVSEPATRGEGDAGRLRVPPGPIRTPTPWNEESFGAEWSNIARWAGELEEAARDEALDVQLPAVVMTIETQGIHERDGVVLQVWDDWPEDGPSVGLMQVKPRVWQYLAPEADAYTPEGNIRLGTAVLRHLIEKHGSFETAIAEGYHPGRSANGTTPASYVRAARGLLEELGYAA